MDKVLDSFLTSQVKEIELATRQAWLVIEACPYRDPDDGCCAHPDNMTPECHEAICPLARIDGSRAGR